MTTADLLGDPFDRQKGIDKWDQQLIERQSALVLGVGGLGCSVAFGLARLGIPKMTLWDNDTVDVTNLNRQILFSRQHVEKGLTKIEAAKEGIRAHLVGENQVVDAHEGDVLKDWGKIVELAKNSTVIFNNVDIGHYFDFACISLAKSLGIPYVAGSSYSRTWIVEYYSGKPTMSSFSYINKDGDASIFERLHPSKIQSLTELDIPYDPKPETKNIGSNVLVCTTAGLMTVNSWVQGLMGFEMPNFLKSDLALFWKEGETLAWPEPEDDEAITL